MNEKFETIKLKFLEQQRLMLRFLDFSKEFINFEYDTSGINFDDALDIERKAKKIVAKLFDEINNASDDLFFEIVEVKVVKNFIDFSVYPKSENGENVEKSYMKIKFLDDGFELIATKEPEPEVEIQEESEEDL
jgi:hypothetical protein